MHGSLIKVRVLLLALLLALSACGSGTRQVRGELPLVTMEGLERHEGEITLLLGLRNVNDRSLPLDEIEVQMRLNDLPLLDLVHRPDFEIGPRGRDVLRLRGSGHAEGLSVLDRMSEGSPAALEQGALTSAAWQLEIGLTGDRGRQREAEASGFLHAVPGQQNRFR